MGVYVCGEVWYVLGVRVYCRVGGLLCEVFVVFWELVLVCFCLCVFGGGGMCVL